MRNKRVIRFRKHRRRNAIRFLLFAILLPSSSIFVGYLITSLVILPAMAK